MPSIPQSLLWISLVGLWLFVLVPMLITKRETVRRTSDVALATRVLNGRAGSRLRKRGGPAEGHRSDPQWTPAEDEAEEDFADDGEAEAHDGMDEIPTQEAGTDDAHGTRPVAMNVADAEHTDPEYLDVDVVEDSGALPAGGVDEVAEPVEPEGAEPDDQDLGDRYEYVEDSSGLEPEADDQADDQKDYAAEPRATAAPPRGSRRRRFDAKTAAAVTARKYAFRKRVLILMAVVLVGSATAAFNGTPSAWWLFGPATAVTLCYLAYLRRQTRIEEKVRRRRAHRMARSRLGVENTYDRVYDVVPSRLRRPGAVVLEIDDEDPIFEHLDYPMPMRSYGWPRDLPRAVGQ